MSIRTYYIRIDRCDICEILSELHTFLEIVHAIPGVTRSKVPTEAVLTECSYTVIWSSILRQVINTTNPSHYAGFGGWSSSIVPAKLSQKGDWLHTNTGASRYMLNLSLSLLDSAISR